MTEQQRKEVLRCSAVRQTVRKEVITCGEVHDPVRAVHHGDAERFGFLTGGQLGSASIHPPMNNEKEPDHP
jgi:hypothetical protein